MPAFLQALIAGNALAGNATALAASPYGPLAPKRDAATGLPLLMLPEGFTYRTFGWAGDPMANGKPTPGNHDGMGIVAVRGQGATQDVTLVRNHERHMSTRPIEAAAVYDRVALPNGSETASPGGGTVTLVYRGGELVSSTPSLGGTLVNCAGGITPWGTWLTCEETIDDLGARGGRKHGYVFEVPADPRLVTAQPIIGMGRFRHEAALVDPRSGHVYLTEDDPLKSGFYRYVPRDTARGSQALARGGRLQAARVAGHPNADLFLPTQGQSLQIEWVDIADPDAAPEEVDLRGSRLRTSGPFRQAWAAGALRMARGEGLALHGGKLYVIDTSAGPSASGRVGTGSGVIWELDLASQRMRAVFVSERPIAAHMIDNITTGPRGGLLTCEDGGGVPDEHGPGTRLIGVLSSGESYAFAKNNVVLGPDQIRAAAKQVGPGDFRGAEFAGACFTPDGDTLFVNVYTPGFTAAIRGPWSRGPL
jgi:secreted PhoX family phosphatase